MENSIEKSIQLKAPVSRVWRALTDHKEFGEWFRVDLDGPFLAGQATRGQMTYPGYEHVKMRMDIQEVVPETLFSFKWHPYAIDPDKDYSEEELTLVTFRLEPAGKETLLTVKESGFEKVPADRRAEAFRMNEQGWTEQVENIRKHVES
ncbi:MAG: SRPBCC family protein [Rhodomicrobiaceae bacterium]